MFKKIVAPLMAATYLAGAFCVLGTLAACNTVEGAGKDIESGGRAIKDEAREHKDKD